jgi:hypothetical protein
LLDHGISFGENDELWEPLIEYTAAPAAGSSIRPRICKY